jgi:hypothetical protein
VVEVQGSVKVELMGMWWYGGVETVVTKCLQAGMASIDRRGRRADRWEESSV